MKKLLIKLLTRLQNYVENNKENADEKTKKEAEEILVKTKIMLNKLNSSSKETK